MDTTVIPIKDRLKNGKLPSWVLTFDFETDGLECKFLFSTYKLAKAVADKFHGNKKRIQPIDKKWAAANLDLIKPFIDSGAEFIDARLGEILTDWRKNHGKEVDDENSAKD